MAQPQPIIHPPVQDDHPMPSPSDSSFNPASYTRAFFGSPISWRPGSFGNGNRYFPGPSPDQLLSPLECVLYLSLLTPSLLRLAPLLFPS
jgi:transcription factor SFP1